MFKREWVNAGAAVVAAVAAVGLLVVGMVSLAAGFTADVQASIDAVRVEMRTSIEAVQVEMRTSIEAAQAENRALIEAAQAENRAAHTELGRKIESNGERIDRLYELLLAQARP